jgi:hypothetical protein
MRQLTRTDLPFSGYHATTVAIDEVSKRIKFAGFGPWDGGTSATPAFVLELSFEDVHWHDGGDLFYPVNASYNLGIVLEISKVSLNRRSLIIGRNDFGYRVTLAADATIDVYQFSVPPALSDEYCSDGTDELMVFTNLIDISKNELVPTRYAPKGTLKAKTSSLA